MKKCDDPFKKRMRLKHYVSEGPHSPIHGLRLRYGRHALLHRLSAVEGRLAHIREDG